MSTTSNDPVITSYAKAPARTITAGGVTYAYRELGPKGGIPVIFFVHLAANLDNWDPRIIDPIAREHHVIAFDNRGVGASTGQVPDSVEAMADDAYTFIRALGFDKVDIFSFSLGGMVAQALVVKHPELVRKLILTGTGPAGGKDIDKVAGTTYYDILRATLTRSDPKEFLFFNRNATGKPAARAFVNRLKERTVDRDAPVKLNAFQTQLKAIKRWGRSTPADLSKITQPTLIANGDNDRMVPSVLSEDLHRRIPGSELDHLPRLRPRRHLPVPRHVRPRRRRVPRALTAPCEGRHQVATTPPSARKPLASSILLWMRTDQPRQQGMDHWKGPHSKIISATPGMEEYRQIHLAENNPGLWPAVSGVETVIPAERRIDGVAEVTFSSVLSPLRGRKQTRLAYKDEVNVFRRTLLYAGPPYSARWYDVAGPGEKVGARSLIYLRRREGVKTGAFRTFLTRRACSRSRQDRGAAGTPNPGLPALDRTALGHAERRARQPHRPAVPCLTDPRLHRYQRPAGVLR